MTSMGALVGAVDVAALGVVTAEGLAENLGRAVAAVRPGRGVPCDQGNRGRVEAVQAAGDDGRVGFVELIAAPWYALNLRKMTRRTPGVMGGVVHASGGDQVWVGELLPADFDLVAGVGGEVQDHVHVFKDGRQRVRVAEGRPV